MDNVDVSRDVWASTVSVRVTRREGTRVIHTTRAVTPTAWMSAVDAGTAFVEFACVTASSADSSVSAMTRGVLDTATSCVQGMAVVTVAHACVMLTTRERRASVREITPAAGTLEA